MELGKTNTLTIARATDNGCYLVDTEGNEVLLPNAYVTKEMSIGNEVSVFVYKDNLQRITATTLKPKLELEQFAFLEVKEVNKAGAFMDIGLVKQLLIPFKEQAVPMAVGESYVIFMFIDEETNRLVGSSQLEDFLFFEKIEVAEADEVELLLYKRTELGINAVVNNMFQGLIFKNDIHKNVKIGDKIKGFVKKVRADGKIDLLLEPMGFRNVIDATSQRVLNAIKKNDGFLKLTDKSSPDDIRNELGISKKAFKKALGGLYKQKIVLLEKEGTRLV